MQHADVIVHQLAPRYDVCMYTCICTFSYWLSICLHTRKMYFWYWLKRWSYTFQFSPTKFLSFHDMFDIFCRSYTNRFFQCLSGHQMHTWWYRQKIKNISVLPTLQEEAGEAYVFDASDATSTKTASTSPSASTTTSEKVNEAASASPSGGSFVSWTSIEGILAF